MAQVKEPKKPKKQKKKSDGPPKGLKPQKSIFSKTIVKVAIFSIAGAAGVFLITQQMATMQGDDSISEIGMIFAGITGIVPATLFQLREVQRKDSIDKHMPVFLLALLSSVQSGSNLIKALEQAANRNLGALTPELKNLRANISWGMPLEEAFENFAARTGTRISQRVTVLLEMALKIGGDVTENLEMIQKHVSEMQNIEKNRKSQLAPYTYTIYIAYAVFLAVAVLLITSFFSEIEKVQLDLINTGASGSDGLFGSMADMDIAVMESALFNMAIIEAVFGGLAAGKIGAGSYMAGIKHVVVMIVISIIAFNVI